VCEVEVPARIAARAAATSVAVALELDADAGFTTRPWKC